MAKEDFWTRWLVGNDVERRELVEGLPFYTNLRLGKADAQTTKQVLSLLLNDYFCDLEEALLIQQKESR
jgi:hypothetical protein